MNRALLYKQKAPPFVHFYFHSHCCLFEDIVHFFKASFICYVLRYNIEMDRRMSLTIARISQEY